MYLPHLHIYNQYPDKLDLTGDGQDIWGQAEGQPGQVLHVQQADYQDWQGWTSFDHDDGDGDDHEDGVRTEYLRNKYL